MATKTRARKSKKVVGIKRGGISLAPLAFTEALRSLLATGPIPNWPSKEKKKPASK